MTEHTTQFFAVWNPNKGNPTVLHGNQAQAEAEARRLAGISKDTFYVLKAVSSFKQAEPPICRRELFPHKEEIF